MILTIHYQLVKFKGWTQDFHVTILTLIEANPLYGTLDPEKLALCEQDGYLGNNWYYLRSSGAMATGWKYVRGSRYYT